MKNCYKTIYTTRGQAERAAKGVKGSAHPYYCNQCCGYHITSMDDSRYDEARKGHERFFKSMRA